MTKLQAALEDVARKIERYRSKGINEQDSKASLIQPVLRALGWDVEDLEEVQREYKRRPKDMPVDFALSIHRAPRLFVEAKALGHNLEDLKWANQIMAYASLAGIEWVVLTDGNEYRLYNSHATVPIEEKLFRVVRVSDVSTKPAETLELLSKDRIRDKEIDVLWAAHFVDHQIQGALTNLFKMQPDPDRALVRLIRKQVKNLTLADIKASLRRVRVQFDFPVPPSDGLATPLQRRRERARKPKEQSSGTATDDQPVKQFFGISLQEIITAGLIKTPMTLEQQYRGRQFTAQLLTDGRLQFSGKVYDSCSTAADEARRSILGGTPHTNGWSFWKYKNDAGDLVPLDHARRAYIQRQAKSGRPGSDTLRG